MKGWTEYCVKSPKGNPSNHHYTADGLLGERVTPETATCKIVVDDKGHKPNY